MFHSQYDIFQAFETCPGHPLLPLGVVNKEDGDHLFSTSNLQRKSKLSFLMPLLVCHMFKSKRSTTLFNRGDHGWLIFLNLGVSQSKEKL